MKKWGIPAALIGILVLGISFGGTDFSGNWKLDLDKSDFGQMPAPYDMTYTIKHSEPEILVEWMFDGDWGTLDGESKYSTDGKPVMNAFGQMEMESTGEPEGSENPKVIFGKPFLRDPDSAKDPRFQILPARERILELFPDRVPGHGVHREIPSGQIFLKGIGELDHGVAARGLHIFPEGRDLQEGSIPGEDPHRPVLHTHRNRPGE